MLYLFLALMPGRVHCMIRRMLGQSIHATARLSFGVLIQCSDVQLGGHSKISPLVRVKARTFHLGDRAHIASLVTVNCYTVKIGSDSLIAPINFIAGDASSPRSTFVMGSHSSIFSFSWMDPGHGISLGDRVGIGGHGLIFTHGSWANYFLGAPVAAGPVHIGDRVWLPWRVFVMPGVDIGEDAIIGAGSVVTKSVAPGALAAGSPAKELRARAYSPLSAEMLKERIEGVVEEFLNDNPAVERNAFAVLESTSNWPSDGPSIAVTGMVDSNRALEAAQNGTSVVDVIREVAWLAAEDDLCAQFTSWLTRYGVRADVIRVSGSDNALLDSSD